MAKQKFKVVVGNDGVISKTAARTLAQMILEFYNDPENRRAFEEERKAAMMAAPVPQ
jgi:hypothetical protein